MLHGYFFSILLNYINIFYYNIVDMFDAILSKSIFFHKSYTILMIVLYHHL